MTDTPVVPAWPTWAVRLGLLAFLGVSSACGRPAFVLPAGPPTPAPDGSAIWAAAAARCRAAKTYSAELHVSGRIGDGPRLKATVLAGFTTTDDIRLEMGAPFGRPIFVLAGTNGSATLVTRDDRVLTAPAAQIVDALVGLPFGPRALLALLTACSGQDAVVDAVRYGDVLAVRTSDVRVYLRQTGAEWRVIASDVADLRIEYSAGADGWPADLRISSQPGRVPALALGMNVRQIEVNAPMTASTFSVTVPAAAVPLSLAELRTSGPLGERPK
jgi:hypothetical protein